MSRRAGLLERFSAARVGEREREREQLEVEYEYEYEPDEPDGEREAERAIRCEAAAL